MASSPEMILPLGILVPGYENLVCAGIQKESMAASVDVGGMTVHTILRVTSTSRLYVTVPLSCLSSREWFARDDSPDKDKWLDCENCGHIRTAHWELRSKTHGPNRYKAVQCEHEDYTFYDDGSVGISQCSCDKYIEAFDAR